MLQVLRSSQAGTYLVNRRAVITPERRNHPSYFPALELTVLGQQRSDKTGEEATGRAPREDLAAPRRTEMGMELGDLRLQ